MTVQDLGRIECVSHGVCRTARVQAIELIDLSRHLVGQTLTTAPTWGPLFKRPRQLHTVTSTSGKHAPRGQISASGWTRAQYDSRRLNSEAQSRAERPSRHTSSLFEGLYMQSNAARCIHKLNGTKAGLQAIQSVMRMNTPPPAFIVIGSGTKALAQFRPPELKVSVDAYSEFSPRSPIHRFFGTCLSLHSR